MISRLTTLAVSFAVLTTASLAFAASSYESAPVAAKPAQVLQLERVVIVGKRLPQDQR